MKKQSDSDWHCLRFKARAISCVRLTEKAGSGLLFPLGNEAPLALNLDQQLGGPKVASLSNKNDPNQAQSLTGSYFNLPAVIFLRN